MGCGRLDLPFLCQAMPLGFGKVGHTLERIHPPLIDGLENLGSSIGRLKQSGQFLPLDLENRLHYWETLCGVSCFLMKFSIVLR